MAEKAEYVFTSGRQLDLGEPVENDYVYVSGDLVSDQEGDENVFISGRSVGTPRKTAFPDRLQITATPTGDNEGRFFLQEVTGPDPPNEVVNDFAVNNDAGIQPNTVYISEVQIPDPITGTHTARLLDSNENEIVSVSGSPSQAFNSNLIGFQTNNQTESPPASSQTTTYYEVTLNGGIVEDFNASSDLDRYEGDLDKATITGGTLVFTTDDGAPYGISTVRGTGFPQPGDTVRQKWETTEKGVARLYYRGL